MSNTAEALQSIREGLDLVRERAADPSFDLNSVRGDLGSLLVEANNLLITLEQTLNPPTPADRLEAIHRGERALMVALDPNRRESEIAQQLATYVTLLKTQPLTLDEQAALAVLDRTPTE